MSTISRRAFGRGVLGALGAAAIPGCASSGPTSDAAAEVARRLADLSPDVGSLPDFPEDTHRERIDRLRQSMRLESVGALFLGPTQNLRYFTGVTWGVSERLFGCVVLPRDPLIFVAPKFEELRARESTDGVGDLSTWEEWEDPHALVAEIVGRNVPGDRLAVDSHARATHALTLARRLGDGRVVDGLPVTARVRARKTGPELARLRRACEITQQAIEIVRERFLRPGLDETTASLALSHAQERLGLRATWCLALFGPNAAYPHGTRERRTLAEGDLALFDTGGDLDGYQSDITRTLPVGAPSERARDVYRLVRRAQTAALAAIRPGLRAEEIDAVARRVIVEGGFGPDAKYFTHRLGHGIGLEGHEDPYFCRGNGTILAPGMTLSNEPGIYVPGELGVRVEDIVVVTADGAETFGTPAPEEI